MPVLLTRPDDPVARATAFALLDDGAEVRVHGPSAASGLRAAGAFVSAGDHDDTGRLEAALAQVHTLVHVGAGVLVDDADRLLHEGVGAIDAAVAAGVRRLLLLSLPGADPGAGEPVRRALGRLEQHAEAAPLASVAVRTGLVDTGPLRDAVAATALPPELDDHVVAPVTVDDLAVGLVALDRARGRAEGHAVFAAPGPEPLTLDAWLRAVGVRTTGGATDFVGRTYRPADAAAPLRGALAGPWVEDDGADLWSFADHVPSAPGSA